MICMGQQLTDDLFVADNDPLMSDISILYQTDWSTDSIGWSTSGLYQIVVYQCFVSNSLYQRMSYQCLVKWSTSGSSCAYFRSFLKDTWPPHHPPRHRARAGSHRHAARTHGAGNACCTERRDWGGRKRTSSDQEKGGQGGGKEEAAEGRLDMRGRRKGGWTKGRTIRDKAVAKTPRPLEQCVGGGDTHFQNQ